MNNISITLADGVLLVIYDADGRSVYVAGFSTKQGAEQALSSVLNYVCNFISTNVPFEEKYYKAI